MGTIEKVFHVTDLKGLCELLRFLGVHDTHPIPLHKILFTLKRKDFLSTIVVERNPECPQYAAECQIQERDCEGLRRLHFFCKVYGEEELLPGALVAEAYGGYCDVRPDSATIASALITERTVIHHHRDGYAFLCCRAHETLRIPTSDGSAAELRISGFHYMEKNRRETMCAQAALWGAVKYWREKAGIFTVETTLDINKKAGLSEAEQTVAEERGLDPFEISHFLGSEGVPHHVRNYAGLTVEGVKRRGVVIDIYGFLESGCPVIAAVKTVESMHALTFIGHTFDKNSWSAMAEVGYFGARVGLYHPNVTWIENFIVQDDNFGPYYFFPVGKLEEIIAGLVVILPDQAVKVFPFEATNIAVREAVFNRDLIKVLVETAKGDEFCEENRSWFDEFVRHLEVTCGDGLVLRPILLTGAQVCKSFKDHEFRDAVETLLGEEVDRHFWTVELSWPDIYCFSQAASGMALVDAETGQIRMLHVPGIWLGFEDEEPFICLAEKEDAPRPHHMPAVYQNDTPTA